LVDSLPERVILDEVQRAPDLFRAIKRSVAARTSGVLNLDSASLFCNYSARPYPLKYR
jgi:predicted AAA+ superfamily ATPase